MITQPASITLSTSDQLDVPIASQPIVSQPIVNAFTVDVEDYFQVSAFEGRIARSEWSKWELRVEDNTQRLLDILAENNVRATFFILGWIAERCPRLVEKIHAAKHEIGSHGYWHRLIYGQTPVEFRQDIARARQILYDITGEKIRAFRAPSFSITQESLWALQILTEEGYEIDSSIFPIRHDRYGIPGALREIHRIETNSGSLWEVPPSVCRVSGLDVPIGGGGYFRLYPLWWTIRRLRNINISEARPFVFYVHPWEIDPNQPKISGVSKTSKFRHRVNLSKTSTRIERLLAEFRFAPLGEVLEENSRQKKDVPTVSLDFT